MKLSFFVDDHPHDTLFYRINVYSNQGNRPGENLLTQNIFVTTTVKNAVVTVDLTPYGLVYDQSVFIGLEYVRPIGTQKGSVVHFGGRLGGARSYVRHTSQSEWMKTPLLNLGYWVEVCQTK